MQTSLRLLTLTLVVLVSGFGASAAGQDKEHPDEAVCAVCAARSTHGSDPEPEKVAGSSLHEGRHYYFCSDDCKREFDASPEWWVPMELPFEVPPLRVRALAGEVVGLDVGGGRLTLLDFWATWCQPCKKTMRELQKRFTDDPDGLRIVGVSIDEGDGALSQVRRFVEKQGATYPIVLDDQRPAAWTALRVRAVPTMMLVDREGRVVWRYTGPDGDEKLDEVLAKHRN